MLLDIFTNLLDNASRTFGFSKNVKPFRLLSLPDIPLFKIISNLDDLQILDISLASRKFTEKTVQFKYRGEKREMTIEFHDGHVTLEREKSSLEQKEVWHFCPLYFLPGHEENTVFKANGLEFRRTFNSQGEDRQEYWCYSNDWVSVAAHVSDVFLTRCHVDNVDIFQDEHLNISPLIKSNTFRLAQNRALNSGVGNAAQLVDVLELPCPGRLYLDTEIQDVRQFQFNGKIQAETLHVNAANWLTPDMFLNQLGDCTMISINEEKHKHLTSKHLNQFLRNWINGNYSTKFKSLEVTGIADLDSTVVMSHVEACRKRVIKRMFKRCKKDMDGGINYLENRDKTFAARVQCSDEGFELLVKPISFALNR